jgi:hypothetical protein
MSTYSGVFTQAPEEKRRYILDYTLTLSTGETVTSISSPINITQTFGTNPPVAAFQITSVVVGPGGLQVVFYANGGDDGDEFEVQFLANTSAGQIVEDVVKFTIRSDL